MRQAIVTKYLGPTNSRGSRIKARCEAGSLTTPYNHALNATENHKAAVVALLVKLNWNGQWRGGGLPGSGYVFVDATQELDGLINVA